MKAQAMMLLKIEATTTTSMPVLVTTQSLLATTAQ
jgi:hypothetical protein